MDFIILIFLICVIIVLYFNTQYNNMTYIKSDIDNQYYLVRDLEDKQKSSNILAKIKKNIFKLTDYVYSSMKKYPEMRQYIKQLNSRIKSVIITESTFNSSYTSYSINKGEQIVFCIRIKGKYKIHDLNLLMYVVIHEMAHVACPETGHTPLFTKIFEFLCYRAIEINIYKKIDFKKFPKEYCGMIVDESVI